MTAKANGYFAPPRDWAALQHAYENHVGPLEPLADANNIQVQTLKGYASARKWVRLFPDPATPAAPPSRPSPKRRSPRVPPTPKPAGSATTPAKDTPPPTPRRLRRRLLGMIALKLDKMEIDMSASEPLPPIDHERHTRALGSLATSVEKLNDIGQPSRGRSGTGKPAAAPETAASDEDKLRRELAARIKRLRDQLRR